MADALFSAPFGLLGRQKIKAMIGRKLIRAEVPLESSQLQPASLDLRLSKEAYRVRASFLPGRGTDVRERLKSLNAEPVSLAGKGAVLEKGIVYVARLMERLELRPNLSGAANPKSSTGRIDIFTRLIVDGGEAFDDVPLEYKGELWLEISPRSFSVRVKAGTKLNQVRFRSRHPQQRDRRTFSLDDADLRKRNLASPFIDGPLDLREGLVVRVDLGGLGEPIVGYRAIRNSDVLDVNRLSGYRIEDFWEPIHAREDKRLILDPDQFYILASREKVQIPSDLAAEMAPI
ncbi:MAG TPA: 2'-deoxycytidine 5'-triphosphate deaminase, partial [Roseiarcus sp.]|nr:2'-deoxycytidine 5'-triphosphate deaminase [Roseiarcus sp.]